MKKKRILMLLLNNPYPQDVRVRNEAVSLSASHFKVTVVCPRSKGQPKSELLNGVQVYRFQAPRDGFNHLGYLWEHIFSTAAAFITSLKAFLRDGVDIVHTHNPPDLGFAVAAFYKLFGKQFVYDHHDLAPEMYSAIYGERTQLLVHRTLLLLERLSCALADHIITTNESYRTVEMSRGKVRRDQITIVRNGPDMNRFSSTSIDHTLRKSSAKKLICYVGSIGRHDGVDYLLKALHHLVNDLSRTDFQCVLVGGGDAVPRVKQMAAEMNLNHHVRFVGHVSPENVGGYIHQADLCVAPEPRNEYNNRSTMIKVMEYMACGKPIVAFNLNEHRVSAGRAALYARPNEPTELARMIVRLMDNPELRLELGKRGRERIENALSWPFQEAELLRAYRYLESVRRSSVFRLFNGNGRRKPGRLSRQVPGRDFKSKGTPHSEGSQLAAEPGQYCSNDADPGQEDPASE